MALNIIHVNAEVSVDRLCQYLRLESIKWVIDESERIQKEAVMTKQCYHSRIFPGGAEENHAKPTISVYTKIFPSLNPLKQDGYSLYAPPVLIIIIIII